jgi:REP element-mobilizing transposase RayT
MKPLYHRRSLRLKGYDYARPGAYFVTICAQDRTYLFGDVVDGQMRLNEFGRIVREAWDDLPNHYPNVEMDAFVIMPNHIHGIIVFVGAGLKPAPTKPAPTKPAHIKPAPTKNHGLPEIVRALKTFSARRINQLRGTPGVPVWQRNYYEHIIRTEQALHAIRRYIVNNPMRWQRDRYNFDTAGRDPHAHQ